MWRYLSAWVRFSAYCRASTGCMLCDGCSLRPHRASPLVAGGLLAMRYASTFRVSRIPSKFDLRRFCRATGATALVAVQAPTPDELGFAKELTVEEVCPAARPWPGRESMGAIEIPSLTSHGGQSDKAVEWVTAPSSHLYPLQVAPRGAVGTAAAWSHVIKAPSRAA